MPSTSLLVIANYHEVNSAVDTDGPQWCTVYQKWMYMYIWQGKTTSNPVISQPNTWFDPAINAEWKCVHKKIMRSVLTHKCRLATTQPVSICTQPPHLLHLFLTQSINQQWPFSHHRLDVTFKLLPHSKHNRKHHIHHCITPHPFESMHRVLLSLSHQFSQPPWFVPVHRWLPL